MEQITLLDVYCCLILIENLGTRSCPMIVYSVNIDDAIEMVIVCCCTIALHLSPYIGIYGTCETLTALECTAAAVATRVVVYGPM